MAVTSKYYACAIRKMVQIMNKNEETSCGMKRFVDKPFRIVLRVAMHLHERLIQG